MKGQFRFLSAATIIVVVTASVALVDAAPLSGAASEGATRFPRIFMRDVVVSNTDRNLQNTDNFANGEPGIAINPKHPNRVVISAFSGAWQLPNGTPTNAPLWYSKNGGRVWTKVFSIPPPNQVPSVQASPCDQTFDFDRHGNLFGTFLLDPRGGPGECSVSRAMVEEETPTNSIYSGVTTNPAKASKWKWFLDAGGTAQKTTLRAAVDQPWLVVGPDVTRRSKSNVYVAYQGTACEEGGRDTEMQVATAAALIPPDFLIDQLAGCSGAGAANPGHRAAVDTKIGAVYTLYQNPIGNCVTPNIQGGLQIQYIVNRSTDGGHSWSFGNQSRGTVVAEVCSDQVFNTYSFGVPDPGNPNGGVNLLLGGIDALAVDSKSATVYVVYGAFDEQAERDQLKMVSITSNGGVVKVSDPVLVSPADKQAALPAVAVTRNGAIGILYDTADGLVGDEANVPTFSAHLAVSRDHGKSFVDTVILHFRSPIPTTGGVRILGDFQQLKALGNTFYGVFSGNGHDLPAPFNRKTDAIDPIFFKTRVR